MSNLSEKFKNLFPIIETIGTEFFEHPNDRDVFVISFRDQVFNATTLVNTDTIDQIFNKINKSVPELLNFTKTTSPNILLNLNSITENMLRFYVFRHNTPTDYFEQWKTLLPFNAQLENYYEITLLGVTLLDNNLYYYKYYCIDNISDNVYNYKFDSNFFLLNTYTEIRQTDKSFFAPLNIDFDALAQQNVSCIQTIRNDNQSYLIFKNLIQNEQLNLNYYPTPQLAPQIQIGPVS